MNLQTKRLLLDRLVAVQPQLAQDQAIIAYHGTRSSALQSIRDNGILSHPFKHYHPSRFYKGARGASVYVTENPNIATQWALSEVDDPSLATILQVVIPREGLHPDEEAPEAERFLGDIPPEWIQATYQILPDGSLGPAVPFHADPRLSQAAEDDTKSKRFMVIQHKGGWSVPHFDAEFEENKHPRDKTGEFAKSGSSGGAGTDLPVDQEGKFDRVSKALKNSQFKHYGIRVVSEDPSEISEKLPETRRWEKGNPTNEKVGGVSVVELDPSRGFGGPGREINRVLSRVSLVYEPLFPNGTVLLVGSNEASPGEDHGELVLHNSKVISVIGRTPKKNAQDAAKLPKDQVAFEHPAQGPYHCGECQPQWIQL
jgi:hypothetical protein